MNGQNSKIKIIVFILFGIMLASGSVFFAFYTARLIYINLTAADAAARRSGGILIGAITFPFASIIFGFLSWFCFKKAGISKGKQ